MLEPSNDVTPDNHFDMLLKFLKKQEVVLERLEQLKNVKKIEKPEHFHRKKDERRYVSTKMASEGLEDTCFVCGDGGHNDILKKLGACRRCLGLHDGDGFCKDTYLCRNKTCKKAETLDHYYFIRQK